MYSHMDSQCENNVGAKVIIENDMTQPSTTTKISTKVLPRPKIMRENHQQENVAQKQKRV